MRTRILLAGDEPSQCVMLADVLGKHGHDVATADTAEQAVRMCAESSYPLVITDMRMPGMNGIELLQRVKALDPLAQVIIVTANASLDSALDALRAGAYDYLIKPLDIHAITAAVARATDKLRLLHENKALLERLTRYNYELEQVNEVLRDLAIRDSLTGLYNHRYFQEAIAVEVSRGRRHERPFSLVFCDIDHFKAYNDTHGHPLGDALLRDIAQILKARIRKSDVAARYGGEEFMVLLPETTPQGAYAFAEDIRAQVARAGREPITISAGVATFPENGNDSANLIFSVNRALNEAKRAGRNQVRRA